MIYNTKTKQCSYGPTWQRRRFWSTYFMSYVKYTKEMIQEAVSQSTSYRQVLISLGLAPDGGNATHMKNRIIKEGIDTSHFLGKSWNKGKPSPKRKSANEILVLGTIEKGRTDAALLRRALNEIGIEYVCVLCRNNGEHNGQTLRLEVDHVNGRFYDNRIENLRYLCPNCHSQCETNKGWRSKVCSRTVNAAGLGPVTGFNSTVGSTPTTPTCEVHNICVDCTNHIRKKSTRCKSCVAKRQPTKIS